MRVISKILIPLLFFVLFFFEAKLNTLFAQNILASTPIEDGWLLQDDPNFIYKVDLDANLAAKYPFKSQINYSGVRLLCSDQEGNKIALILWNDEGEEALGVWNLSNDREINVIDLEGHSLRAIRMSDSGEFIAVLLSNGHLYTVDLSHKYPLLKQEGTIPTLNASEWVLNNEGNLKWIEAKGAAYKRTLKRESLYRVQNLFDLNSEQSLLAVDYDDDKAAWLLQNRQGSLYIIEEQSEPFVLNKSRLKLVKWFHTEWALMRSESGQYQLQHLLLPITHTLQTQFQSIIDVSDSHIIGINYQNRLSVFDINELYQIYYPVILNQKRIRLEESTNSLSSLHLDRSSSDYLQRKASLRAKISTYLDKTLANWEQDKPSPITLLNWNSESISSDKANILSNSTIRWEHPNLSTSVEAGDEINLFFKLKTPINTYEHFKNSLQVIWLETNELLPLNWLAQDLSQNNIGVRIQLPNQFYTGNTWLLALKVGSSQKVIEIPNGRTEAIDLKRLDFTAVVKQNKFKSIQIDARLDKALKQQISLVLVTDQQRLSNKIVVNSSESGEFNANLNIIANQDRLPNFFQLAIQIGHEPSKRLHFKMQQTYPYLIEGVKSEDIPVSTIHPLLDDLPQKSTSYSEDTYALLIGNRDYKYAPSADYALRDVRFMHTYLTDVLGVPESHIFLSENAALADFRFFLGEGETNGRLMDIPQRNQKRLIVYYSGHGLPSLDGQDGYLLSTDARLNRPDISSMALSTFYDQLYKLEMGEVVVFLESCFSGQTASGENLFPSSSGSVGVRLKNPLLAQDHVAIFTASGASELSSWDHNYHTGLFTARLLEGLRYFAHNNTEAKAEDLYEWLSDPQNGVSVLARERFSRDQHPQLITNDFQLPLFKKRQN